MLIKNDNETLDKYECGEYSFGETASVASFRLTDHWKTNKKNTSKWKSLSYAKYYFCLTEYFLIMRSAISCTLSTKLLTKPKRNSMLQFKFF